MRSDSSCRTWAVFPAPYCDPALDSHRVDNYEQPIMDYVTLGHLWAKIEPPVSRQYLAASKCNLR